MGAPCYQKDPGGGEHPYAHGCYWDASTKSFVANYRAGKRWPNVGANDTQANSIVHMIPLMAALAGGANQRQSLQSVEELIRVTQNTDEAAAFGLAGARILSGVIQGWSLENAVTSVTKTLQDAKRVLPKQQDAFLAGHLEEVLSQLDRPNYDVVMTVGQSCDYAFGLWSGSHLAAQLSDMAAKNGTRAYMVAMRQTIEAGGDSGSRGGYVGALFGAAAGESGIPAAWKKRYTHYETVRADATKWLHRTSDVSVNI